MSDPIDIPLDADDRLYEPPLVDLLRFDDADKSFTITFIPSNSVSSAPSEHVRVTSGLAEFHRIHTLFADIARLLGSEPQRIVHGVGGNFVFHLNGGDVKDLADIEDNSISQQISDRLKQIADSAQSAFAISKRHVNRPA